MEFTTVTLCMIRVWIPELQLVLRCIDRDAESKGSMVFTLNPYNRT